MMTPDVGAEGRQKKMGLWAAVSLAVGTMIGASIFSIFGLGARVAGHNLPLVFVISGALALLVAYSYATLGSKIVSNAGPMEFILRGMGNGVTTGALSILNWFAYVVSISLFAKGFAGYFLPAVGMASTRLSQGLVAAGVIGLFAALGILGAQAVARAEFFMVLAKVLVLGVFIVLGMWTIRRDWIVPTLSGQGIGNTLDAVSIFFLSYMGFGLITNASENIETPARNVPRAIYLSVLIVLIVYVLVAAVALGNLPLDDLVAAGDNALAQAAQPFLGRFGYMLVSLGALLSISSALNATLLGGANVAYALAKDGELPVVFERKAWFGAPEGLYITAGLGIVFALAFNLNGIASMTSAIVMMIYLFVLLSHYRLAGEYGGNRGFILFAFAGILAVLFLLLKYQWNTNRFAFHATWIILLAALGLETAYRAVTHRELVRREWNTLRRAIASVRHDVRG